VKDWRIEVRRLAVRTGLRYWREGFPESTHRLKAGLVGNVPVQMQIAAFWTGLRRERWLGASSYIGELESRMARTREW